MLPGSPIPARGLLGSLFRPLLAAALSLLLLGLAGCQGVGQPPRSVLLQALTLQIELTQGAIAEALHLEAGGVPEVSRVRVEHQEPVAIGEGRGLHLTGQFDWRLSGDRYRVDSPFELYLLRGERGESWRLARPIGGSEDGATAQSWITDPLPLKGDRAA
jgi:hypothetical protein